MLKRRVFVSVISNPSLNDRRRQVKDAILRKVSDAGFELQEFLQSGMAARLAWSFENVDLVMRRCVGAVAIGFPRWTASEQYAGVKLISEYNHYEGAVALTYGLPVFLLAERGVEDRGVVWTGGGKPITYIPEDADASWVDAAPFVKRDDPGFVPSFLAWKGEVESRKDVFLGYCSNYKGTAAEIQIRLENMGVSVLNYAMDFRPGTSILNEIESARANCSCGIFLFSEDDFKQEGSTGGAAPRDNVVFEAGYFMSSKGPDRCLIVREGEAKMPADVGGAIYLNLRKGGDVADIEGRLRSFIENNL